ncbi:MAG: hypothetical protein ACYDGO_06610 [Smithellaceae bacterium]
MNPQEVARTKAATSGSFDMAAIPLKDGTMEAIIATYEATIVVFQTPK